MDSQPHTEQADLLAESLSDSEVRTLLERLGSVEFGGSEDATLGAVVEATGSDVATVGRLLAEIRRGEFEKKFGVHLQDHGQRIESLEEQARQVGTSTYIFQPPLDPYKNLVLERLAEAEIRKENRSFYGYIWAGLIAVIAITAMVVGGAKLDSAKADQAFPGSGSSYSVATTDGEVFLDSSDKVWVRLKKGGTREATGEEYARVYSAKASSERAK